MKLSLSLSLHNYYRKYIRYASSHLGVSVHKNEAKVTVRAFVRELEIKAALQIIKALEKFNIPSELHSLEKFNIPITKTVENNKSIKNINPKKTTTPDKVPPKVSH